MRIEHARGPQSHAAPSPAGARIVGASLKAFRACAVSFRQAIDVLAHITCTQGRETVTVVSTRGRAPAQLCGRPLYSYSALLEAVSARNLCAIERPNAIY